MNYPKEQILYISLWNQCPKVLYWQYLPCHSSPIISCWLFQSESFLLFVLFLGDHCGPDRMVVGFTTTYRYNQYLSPLMLWVRTPLRWGVLDTTLCDKVCQVVGLPNNSYKPITNTVWIHTQLCKLQKRVHSTRSHKW